MGFWYVCSLVCDDVAWDKRERKECVYVFFLLGYGVWWVRREGKEVEKGQ